MRVRHRSPLVPALLCLLCPTPQALGASKPRLDGRPVAEVRAVRADDGVNVDGRLDDAVWSRAPVADTFLQRDPEEGQDPSQRTELRVAYDEDALYVGVRLFDSEPGKIARRLSRRDEEADADSFTLHLDPHHDHLTGARFTVTAAGVQADAAIYNDSWTDDSWDAVWDAAVSADEQGWSLEMRIPFSQLRFSAAERHVWGLNASRAIQRRNEYDWLELVPRNESGLASRMGHLTGLDGIRPRAALSLLPYFATRAELVQPGAGGDPFNDGARAFGGLGLDAKYGLTSNLTLDVTVNPDFGQVEVDPAVVNLSQFETFFEERRLFFIEGAQIFGNFGRNGANDFWGFNRSEPSLFYSRRIGRAPRGAPEAEYADGPAATTILGAAKLTGKTASGWSVALLDAVTAREWSRTASDGRRGRSEVEPLTNYLVARAHRDVSGGGFGLMGTAVWRDPGALAESLPRSAYALGTDGFRFLGAKKEWVVTGRLVGSRVAGEAAALEALQRAPQRYFQRPDAGHLQLDAGARSLSGWSGSLNLNRNSGDLLLNAALWATSPGFESNDLGFNSRSDRYGGHVVGTWRKLTPDRVTRRRYLSVAKWYAFNFAGQRQGDQVNVMWRGELRNYWWSGGNFWMRRRGANDQLTRGGPSTLGPGAHGGGAWVDSDGRRRVSGGLELFAHRNEAGGSGLEAGAWLRLKPAAGLQISLNPSYQRSRTVAQYVTESVDSQADATYGTRYVFGRLAHDELVLATRLNWILSPRLSIQLYAQPLVSAGRYGELKALARPASYDFLRYGLDGASTLAYDAARRSYALDADGPGPAPALAVDDPDFNYKSLRVNAVVRWEYRPGSTLFAVWTQSRADEGRPGEATLGRGLRDLFGAAADDVFMLKLAHRFGR